MPERLTMADIRLTAEAALLVLAAPALARMRPESMHRLLETRLRKPRRVRCSDEQLMRNVDRAINRLPHHGDNRCLVRGITGYRLLRASGRDVHLVFGARLNDRELEAHCWLSDGSGPVHERAPSGAPFDEMFRITPGGVTVR